MTRAQARHAHAEGGGSLAIPRELVRVAGAALYPGMLGLPVRLARAALKETQLARPLAESQVFDLIGENVLALFDALGPLYGKAGQLALSRLSQPLHAIADSLRLTRLYKDWPPLEFAEVEQILDLEVPRWRMILDISPIPLGVASIAQVHAAVDKAGRPWVVKVVKPHARRRLLETVAALEQAVRLALPFAATVPARRSLGEINDLARRFRGEVELLRERQTIERVHEKLKAKRQKVLVIPEVHPELCSDSVLTIERFSGTPLSAIVSGKIKLPAATRQKLARGLLAELLVSVFELGLFHGDPHAGNLILLDQDAAGGRAAGVVGIFDWGLAGELTETDRQHIGAILRAVISADLDQLVEALIEMGRDEGKQLAAEAVRHELRQVITLIKRGQADASRKPSLQQLFEACLKGATKLGLRVPDGLLMMVKSLVTIEGLAKGIDPEVSLARIATPVLLKAASPGLMDLMTLGKRLPQLARLVLGR